MLIAQLLHLPYSGRTRSSALPNASTDVVTTCRLHSLVAAKPQSKPKLTSRCNIYLTYTGFSLIALTVGLERNVIGINPAAIILMAPTLPRTISTRHDRFFAGFAGFPVCSTWPEAPLPPT